MVSLEFHRRFCFFLAPKYPYGCGTLGLLTASTSPHMIHSNKINEDGIRMLLLIVGMK